jgi:hypothetical protein
MYKDDTHYTIIKGKNKSGKTTLAINLMEKANDNPKLRFKGFGSNVQGVKNCPFEMDFITDLESLKKRVKEVGKYLFLFDEMGMSMGKRRFMAKLNTEFLSQLQVIRKYKLSLIGCAIGDSVDREMLQPYYLNSYIDKGSRYTKKNMTYFDIDLESTRSFTNLAKCQSNFKQYSVARFYTQRILKTSDFKDEKLQRLVQWAGGVPIKDLGIHYELFNRELRAFVAEKLREANLTQLHTRQSEATP